MDLLGDEPVKKPKRGAKKAESDGAVERLFACYRQAFRQKWNPCAPHRSTGCLRCAASEWTPLNPDNEVTPLIHYGRDGKHLKNLSDAWGEATVTDVIRGFFASMDPQVIRSDYSIVVLFATAQRLRIQSARPVSDQRTLENTDAALRATAKRQ